MKRSIALTVAGVLAAAPVTTGIVAISAATATVIPAIAREAQPGDDRGGKGRGGDDVVQVRDDKGGRGEAQPGDDKGGRIVLVREAQPTDDRGGHHDDGPLHA